MKIGIIFHGSFPPYNRGIDQLAQSLVLLGHVPTIIARSIGDDRVEDVNGVPLVQIPRFGDDIFHRYKYHHFPYNPFWARLLVKLAHRYQWESIIVRDLPLSGSVLIAAKKLGIPAYLDLRENHVEMYKSVKNRSNLFHLTHHPWMVKWYENATIRSFRHVFVVSEELRQWAISTYKLDANKISVLENTPNKLFLSLAASALKEKKQSDTLFRMVYAGYLEDRKGLGDIVEAMPLIIGKCPNVRLRVIGEGGFLAQLKKLVSSLGVSDYVEFLPMLDLVDLAMAIAECDLGLETCFLNTQTNQTTPGKLFEYMALGLPIVSSARKPVKRILHEVGCGAVYESRKPEDIANVVCEIVADESRHKEMGKRAHEAIIKRYNFQYNLTILKNGLI